MCILRLRAHIVMGKRKKQVVKRKSKRRKRRLGGSGLLSPFFELTRVLVKRKR